MAKRLATTGMGTVVFLLALLGGAHATDASSPEVRLDCEHGVAGCAGMSGEFTTDDASPITSFVVDVQDMATGTVIDVTATACRLATRPENPETTLVTCMLDASELGIDGDIVWSVWVNGDEVWASAPTPTRCAPEPITPEPITPEPTTPEPTTTTIAPIVEEPPPSVPESTTTTTTAPPQVDTTKPPPPADVTDTTTGFLVSPVGPPPTIGTTMGTGTEVVTVAAQETLPATGISLGVLAAMGLTLLGVGVAIEAFNRTKVD